jgi:hypothetical protein
MTKQETGLQNPGEENLKQGITEEKYRFKPTQELESFDDSKKIADWFQNEIEESFEASGGGTYNLEYYVGNLMGYLSQKMDIKTDGVLAKTRINKITNNRATQDSETDATMVVNGIDIFSYIANGDCEASTLYWNDKGLKDLFIGLLKTEK